LINLYLSFTDLSEDEVTLHPSYKDDAWSRNGCKCDVGNKDLNTSFIFKLLGCNFECSKLDNSYP